MEYISLLFGVQDEKDFFFGGVQYNLGGVVMMKE